MKSDDLIRALREKLDLRRIRIWNEGVEEPCPHVGAYVEWCEIEKALDELAALLRSGSTPQPEGWQPMETAPRDGTLKKLGHVEGPATTKQQAGRRVTPQSEQEPREQTWGPEYQHYHVRMVEAIRARMFVRWPPSTVAERRMLERNLRFFDEACDYLEEFGEHVEPEEIADDQLDAAAD